MWGGVEALEQKRPCLIVDFKGLKGFSAELIVHNLRSQWPGLRAVRISFPGTERREEVLPEHMANALILAGNRKNLAQRIRPEIKDARSIGLPAVLGLYQSPKTASDLSELIGVPVFEIPTMPPSIPGLRLKEAFERELRERRPYYFSQKRVVETRQEPGGEFKIGIESPTGKQAILSQGIILTTGRFIGGGLRADRKHVRETIFDLPVYQPESRNKWHREDFLDLRGHSINLAGVEIDDYFSPLNHHGQPAFSTLFAAGSILAHQDWKRMKCGTGLAVGTAFGAVKAFINIAKK